MIIVKHDEVAVLVVEILGKYHGMVGIDERGIGCRHILGLEGRLVSDDAAVGLGKAALILTRGGEFFVTAPHFHTAGHDKGITAHVDIGLDNLINVRHDGRAARRIRHRAAGHLHDTGRGRIAILRPAGGIEHLLQLHPAGGVLGTVGRGVTAVGAAIRYIVDISLCGDTSYIDGFFARRDAVGAVVLIRTYIDGTVLDTVGKIDVGRRQRDTGRLVETGH